MTKPHLVVSVKAHIDWIDPPVDKATELMRQHANMTLQTYADKLNQAVGLILLEMLRPHIIKPEP